MTLLLLILLWFVIPRWFKAWTRYRLGISQDCDVVGFFHPYCNSGGGGERVLWRAVHAINRSRAGKGRKIHVLIYTGDRDAKPADIVAKVQSRFKIPVEASVDFVYLVSRGMLEASRYPVFTMLGQSLGSMVVALEALLRATPDIFFDSTGYAFSFVPARLLTRCLVGAYVHYPTISTDMLSRVREKRPSYNNRAWVAQCGRVSTAKLVYYRAFALLYRLVGSLTDVVMVNSNWTFAHIESMWGIGKARVVFPPCDTSEMLAIPLTARRERIVLSLGQFRPEKDHILQLNSLLELHKLGKEFQDVELVMLGSCRGAQDEALVESLKKHAKEMGLAESVKFVLNCSFEELQDWLARASVGIHTMWNEHFGIGVVEMMAAGMVTVAHRSGGPQCDIIQDGKTGYLAVTPGEYSSALRAAFSDEEAASAMRQAARATTERFSCQQFDTHFTKAFAPLLKN
ncbi:unnamed protein product [Chrysoparadoxa australica]